VGHRYAPMAAGNSACATRRGSVYLGRVLVRVSRDWEAKPQGVLRIQIHAASAIPDSTRIRAATVSGFRPAKLRNRCSALRGGKPAAIGGRCRVQRPAEVLPQRRRRL
jgi:hypothetical protein